MRLVVCTPSSYRDCYGHLERYAKQIVAVAATRGIDAEVLRYSDRAFFSRLFADLADKNCIIHFHGFLYDLRIKTSAVADSFTHAIESSKATTLATIGDHPFADFMQEMIANAHPKTKFVVLEKAFTDEMCAINPGLHAADYDYQPISPPNYFDESLITNFDERYFDLVVPMRIVDTPNNRIDEILETLGPGWFGEAVAAAYKMAVRDISRSPFHILQECIQNKLGAVSMSQIRNNAATAFERIINVVHVLDGLVRLERRQKIVSNLLRDVDGLKVALTCDPISSLNVDPRVSFVGSSSAERTVALMANARAILNCNPSYPTNLHERMVVGMLYGSCMITDVNPYIQENLTQDQYVPYDLDLQGTIADIFSNYDVASVATAGARSVRGNPAFSMETHVEGLLRFAAA